LKILYYALYTDNFTVTEVSNSTGVTKGLVSRFLDYMHSQGLLRRERNRFNVIYSAKTRALKLLLNVARINATTLYKDWIRALGLFGNWALGTNTLESDIDVWVKVDPRPPGLELARLQQEIGAMTSSDVNLITITPEYLKTLRDDEPLFHSLMRTSYPLIGDDIVWTD
jgi:predicted nucleotidyltransferase